MVIGFMPDVARRHSKQTAPVLGWDVLVIWMDADARRVLEVVKIPSNPYHNAKWKPGWPE